MKRKFVRLDGRHKFAIFAAIGSWGLSVWFSQQGFSLDAPKSQWIGWILAGVVTAVELVFNSRTQKLSLTLITVGILCYLYGVWTNVVGFWSYQNPGMTFPWLHSTAILSWFVGCILEILPEPLLMWGIGSELEGDLLGNLAGLWSGNLDYAKPESESPNHKDHKFSYPIQEKSKYTPKHKPEHLQRKPPYVPGMYSASSNKKHSPME